MTDSWSAHAPICITIEDCPKSIPALLWRMNSNLLQSTSYSKALGDNLEEFLTINIDSVSKPAILWTAHKAHMRGVFIKLGARAKQERR